MVNKTTHLWGFFVCSSSSSLVWAQTRFSSYFALIDIISWLYCMHVFKRKEQHFLNSISHFRAAPFIVCVLNRQLGLLRAVCALAGWRRKPEIVAVCHFRRPRWSPSREEQVEAERSVTIHRNLSKRFAGFLHLIKSSYDIHYTYIDSDCVT